MYGLSKLLSSKKLTHLVDRGASSFDYFSIFTFIVFRKFFKILRTYFYCTLFDESCLFDEFWFYFSFISVFYFPLRFEKSSLETVTYLFSLFFVGEFYFC